LFGWIDGSGGPHSRIIGAGLSPAVFKFSLTVKSVTAFSRVNYSFLDFRHKNWQGLLKLSSSRRDCAAKRQGVLFGAVREKIGHKNFLLDKLVSSHETFSHAP
jgi:hypothetical protein